MDKTASSAYGFSLHEFGFAWFNDERLTKRAVEISATLLQHPQESIPQANGSWAKTKATYRFFANRNVQSGNMLQSHREQIQQRLRKETIVLVAQDTSTLNLSGRKIEGVGSISGGTSTGLFVHSGLAMTTQGIPVGIATQRIYARDAKTQTKEYKKKAALLPIEEKESLRWKETIEQMPGIFPDKQVVVIGDRESDIYEVFAEAHTRGVDVLIRTKQNRILEEQSKTGGAVKLFDTVQVGNIITSYETDIPVDQHRTRKATLTIRVSNILLPDSRGHRQSIPVTILNVAEENPPGNTEPIHWMLTTSLNVQTAAEAKEKVQWYIHRWRIERFHYVLKTGAFNIEKLQFETYERFAKAITLYSILAARILYTQYYEKAHPEEDAAELYTPEEIRALCLSEEKYVYTMTIHEAVRATAKMGGHLGRKRDGSPGIKALWIGFQKLHYIVIGMQMEKMAQKRDA